AGPATAAVVAREDRAARDDQRGVVAVSSDLPRADRSVETVGKPLDALEASTVEEVHRAVAPGVPGRRTDEHTRAREREGEAVGRVQTIVVIPPGRATVGAAGERTLTGGRPHHAVILADDDLVDVEMQIDRVRPRLPAVRAAQDAADVHPHIEVVA